MNVCYVQCLIHNIQDNRSETIVYSLHCSPLIPHCSGVSSVEYKDIYLHIYIHIYTYKYIRIYVCM